jgi:hypothetical protein
MVLLTDDTNMLTAKKSSNIKFKRLWRCCSHGFINTIYVKQTNNGNVFSHQTKQKSTQTTRQIQQYRYCIYIRIQILSIHTTENTKLNVHVKSLSSKLSKVSHIIKSLNAVMSPHAIRSIYFANFHVHLRHSFIFFWVRILKVTTPFNCKRVLCELSVV